MIQGALAPAPSVKSLTRPPTPTHPFTPRLVIPGQTSTPLDVRKATLRSMRKLLPRMALASYASAVLHPLIKV